MACSNSSFQGTSPAVRSSGGSCFNNSGILGGRVELHDRLQRRAVFLVEGDLVQQQRSRGQQLPFAQEGLGHALHGVVQPEVDRLTGGGDGLLQLLHRLAAASFVGQQHRHLGQRHRVVGVHFDKPRDHLPQLLGPLRRPQQLRLMAIKQARSGWAGSSRSMCCKQA